MSFTDQPPVPQRGRRPAAGGTSGSARPTMAMVAARVGVSKQTVDCFVITVTRNNDPRITFLLERGIPFVAFGRPWDHPMSDTWWVDVDGAAGVEQAVHHLAERGHQRIAYLGWDRPSGLGDDR